MTATDLAAIPMPLIVRCVAKAFGVDERMIYALRRTEDIIPARFAVYWVAHRIYHGSHTQIGRELGSRDHTVVPNGIRQTEERRATDPDFAAKLDAIVTAVKEIAGTALAARFAEPDPVLVAQKVVDAPRGLRVTRVSTIELVAICARLLDLEDIAGATFQLLHHLDELTDNRVREPTPALIARECHLRANARALSDTIASTLAMLGYVTEAGPEQETATPQQEIVHATASA